MIVSEKQKLLKEAQAILTARCIKQPKRLDTKTSYPRPMGEFSK